MRAVTWQGRRKVSVDTVPDPAIKEPTDAIIRVTSTNICGSDLHLYEVLGAFMTPGRHPRPRGDGRGRGSRRRGGRPQSRRPRGDSVQHLLRALLHVRPGPAEPVRDHAEPRPGHRRRAVRLLQAVRRGRRRAGRVPSGAAGAVHPHQGAAGRPGRAVRIPVRRAAHRVAGRRVRRRARGRHAGGARFGPDRIDGLPDRCPPQLPRDRRRPRRRTTEPRAGVLRRRHRPPQGRTRGRRAVATPTDAAPTR